MSAPERPLSAAPDWAGPPSPAHPVEFDIVYPDELDRWLPLVKWLLAIPHYFALFFLGIGALFVGFFGFFAVLVLGRWPRGAWEYLVGVYRWSARVTAYVHLMTDVYPPFMLQDVEHPVRLTIDYPEHVDRWRPLVQWLLVIPYAIGASVLYWLTGVLTCIAFVCVLFTKQIPRGLFEAMVPGLRWSLRTNAYASFLVTRYPPFVWG